MNYFGLRISFSKQNPFGPLGIFLCLGQSRGSKAPQPQSIGYNRYRGKPHRRDGKNGVEQYTEKGKQHPGRHRDQNGVVGKCPEQVLFDVSNRCPAQGDGRPALLIFLLTLNCFAGFTPCSVIKIIRKRNSG